MKQVSILSFTGQGAALSDHIAEKLRLKWEPCKVLQYEKTSHPGSLNAEQITVPLTDWCREAFGKNDVILFIGAMGITVRSIAPGVSDKFTDPAVLVMDEMGKYIIPVLSGHVGGANAFATWLSDVTGAEPVITTATDLHQLFAVDVFADRNHLVIADRQQAKEISVSLLLGEKVYFYGKKCNISFSGQDNSVPSELIMLTEKEWKNILRNPVPVIAVTDERLEHIEGGARICQLIPGCNILGVGCRKGLDSVLFEETIMWFLEQHNICLQSIAALATIDIKKEERAILAFSEKYHIPVETFTAEKLMQLEGDFTVSDFVLATTGTDNVCERAAIAGMRQKLIRENDKEEPALDSITLKIKKQAGNGMTLAMATADWSVDFE